MDHQDRGSRNTALFLYVGLIYAVYMSHRDKSKVAIYNRKWREKNPNYNRDWKINNRDKVGIYYQKSKIIDPEKSREYARQFRVRNPGYRSKFKDSAYDYYLNNKIKVYARHKVWRAIKTGKLVKPNICSRCINTKNIEADHHDYNKPLDVTWLCRSCHINVTNQRRGIITLYE